MALHTEYSLGSPSIFEILYLLLAIPTFEACCAKSLVAREDCKILDLVPTDATAISAIIADERAVAKEEEVCIGVKNGTAGVATKTVYMPTIAGWKPVSISVSQCHHCSLGPYRVRKPFPPQESGRDTMLALGLDPRGWHGCRQHSGAGQHTSPHPLHGYATSSCSMGDSGKPIEVSMVSAHGLPEPTSAVAIDVLLADVRAGVSIGCLSLSPASLLYSWDTGQTCPHPAK